MNQGGDPAWVDPLVYRVVVHLFRVALHGTHYQYGAGSARIVQPKQPKSLFAVVVYTGDKYVLACMDFPHNWQGQDVIYLRRGVVEEVEAKFSFVVSQHD